MEPIQTEDQLDEVPLQASESSAVSGPGEEIVLTSARVGGSIPADQKAVISDQHAVDMDMQQATEITSQLRNTFGHNIVWQVPALNVGTYNVLVQNVASACLHAISTLYR